MHAATYQITGVKGDDGIAGYQSVCNRGNATVAEGSTTVPATEEGTSASIHLGVRPSANSDQSL